MKTQNRILLSALVATLAACSSTPERIETLETARAIVPQVESSPRAGIAATYISQARKSLDTANRLADDGGNLVDIEHEATMATLNSRIANEKIQFVEAREQIEKGTAERQAVLLQSRENEARAAQARTQSLEQQLADLKAKKTDRGLVLTLGDVLFDTGQATLKPGAYATILDRLAAALKEVPTRKVLIEGHTDSVGAEEFNQQLSQNRALSVQSALLERGVMSSQITSLGKGESTPVASNDNASGRQQNRRVEMVFQDDPAHASQRMRIEQRPASSGW